MHRGYVKLWRKTFDAGLHRDHKLFTLWVWLLANVTHQPLRYLAGDRMLTLRPGQRVVARRALAEELGLTEKEVRTRLRKLERLGCVALSRVGRLTLLSVTNWDRYQHGSGAAIAPADAGSGTPGGAAGAACDALSGPVPGRGAGRKRAAKQAQDHTTTPEKGSCAAGAAPRPTDADTRGAPEVGKHPAPEAAVADQSRPASRSASGGAARPALPPTGEPLDADKRRGEAGAVSPEDTQTAKETEDSTAFDAAAPASRAGYEYARGKRLTGRRLHWFERFWNAFADKRGKAGAARAFAALDRPGEELLERIERAAAEYARRRPALLAAGSTPKMAQGWLTDRRWEDELSDPRSELRAWAEDDAAEGHASGGPATGGASFPGTGVRFREVGGASRSPEHRRGDLSEGGFPNGRRTPETSAQRRFAPSPATCSASFDPSAGQRPAYREDGGIAPGPAVRTAPGPGSVRDFGDDFDGGSGLHSGGEPHAPAISSCPQRRVCARRRSGPHPQGHMPGAAHDAPRQNIDYSKHQTRTPRPEVLPTRTAPAAGGRTGGVR